MNPPEADENTTLVARGSSNQEVMHIYSDGRTVLHVYGDAAIREGQHLRSIALRHYDAGDTGPQWTMMLLVADILTRHGAITI